MHRRQCSKPKEMMREDFKNMQKLQTSSVTQILKPVMLRRVRALQVRACGPAVPRVLMHAWTTDGYSPVDFDYRQIICID